VPCNKEECKYCRSCGKVESAKIIMRKPTVEEIIRFLLNLIVNSALFFHKIALNILKGELVRKIKMKQWNNMSSANRKAIYEFNRVLHQYMIESADVSY